MEEKELFSSNDEFLVSQVESILKENNIPYIRRDEGAGSYMNVTYGQNTTSEKKIIINSEDYDKANELLETFSGKIEDDIPEELKEAEEDEKIDEKYNKPKKIFGIMIGIFFILFFILIITSIILALG